MYWLLGTSVQKYAPLREKILLTLLANIRRVGAKSDLILYWKRRSKASSHQPKVTAETVALVREVAANNRL